MKFFNSILVVFAALLFIVQPAGAQTELVLTSDKDNTLYEDGGGAISNGAGEHFFVGRNKTSNNGPSRRRGVLHFDISELPASAVVTKVELTLYMSKSPSGNGETISVHRLTKSWGEGSSNAGGEEGGGANSASDDATWKHRFYSGTNWSSAGGDFTASESASQSVEDVGFYTWTSTSNLVSDVQSWQNNPGQNHGWLILGNESVPTTAKRFNTREYSDDGTGTGAGTEKRPTLIITYSGGDVTIPDVPTLASPADIATGVAIDATLTWNSVSDADQYDVQVSARSDFSRIFDEAEDITATNFTPADNFSKNETYFWRVRAQNSAGTSEWALAYQFTTGTDVSNEASLPIVDFNLQVWPNPTVESTNLSFNLSQSTAVAIDIFAIDGRRVKTIVSQNYSAGEHQISLSTKGLPAGVYWIRLSASQKMKTIPVIVR